MDAGGRVVHCNFCQRSHGIRGDREFLTTWLAPGTTAEDALILARRTLRSEAIRVTRLGLPRLVFLPYWRFEARAYLWMRSSRLLLLDSGIHAHENELSEVVGRTVDQTFAASLEQTGLLGLSTRPAVLEAHSFDPQALPEGATWLPPAMSPEQARALGRERILDALGHPEGATVSRRELTLLEPQLTLVYVPFYEVSHGFREEPAARVIVDAVAGEVTSSHAPGESCSADTAWVPEAKGLEFLPLVCPDCTMDLRHHDRDQILRCAHCHRAFELTPLTLEAVPETAAASDEEGRTRLVPFWKLSGVLRLPGHGVVRDHETLHNLLYQGAPATVHPAETAAASAAPGELSLWVPGFDHRLPGKALDLCVQLSLHPPEVPRNAVAPDSTATLGRFQAGELARVAWLQYLSLAPRVQRDFAEGGSFEVQAAQLAWVSFERVGGELCEPGSGATLAEIALQPWSGPEPS